MTIHYDTLYNGVARCDSYVVASIPHNPVSGAGTNLALIDDQLSTGIPIGFTFNYWCNNYSTVYISSNGFITFDVFATSGPASTVLPTFSVPNNAISLAWTNLNPGGVATRINYLTTGTAPNRKFVVNYIGVPIASGGTLTGQIVLYEGSNNIDVYTTSLTGNTTMTTQGVENISGNRACATSGRNHVVWNATNDGQRFSQFLGRGTAIPAHFGWTPSGVLSRDSIQAPVATIDSTRTFYVSVSNRICAYFDTVTITVVPPFNIAQNPSICTGDSFRVGSHYYRTAGSYSDTFRIFGTTCDSIVRTNLTILPIATFTRNLTICFGDSLTLGGRPRGTAGTYYDTLVSIVGCDSVLTSILRVNPIPRTTLTPTLCVRDSIRVGIHNYGTTGTYWDTLTSYLGCDSVVNTVLTVLPLNTTNFNPVICQNDTFRIAGYRHFTTSLSYDTVTTAAGCDSILRVNLTVLPWSFTTLNPVICIGDSFLVARRMLRTAGTYYDTLTAANGCDSVITTNLRVNPNSVTNLNPFICPDGSYSVNRRTYTTAGTFYDTLSNRFGCDSILVITVSIYPLRPTTLSPIICLGGSVRVGGSVYNATGVYHDTLADVHGCDSVITTNLTVIPPDYVTLNPVICEGRSFAVGIHRYNVSGTYHDTLRNYHGCDSFITTNLSVTATRYYAQNPVLCGGQSIWVGVHNYANTGRYLNTVTSSVGCDSVITTNLTVNWPLLPVFDTSFCIGHPYGGVVYHADTSIYDTTVSSIGCDSIIRRMNVHILLDPPLKAGLDTSICLGYGARLSASGGNGTYQWIPPFNLSCTSCPYPTATPNSTTLYTVVSANCDGLPLTQQVLVTVNNPPVIHVLTQDTTILVGQQMWLNTDVDSANTVNWHISRFNVCSNCPNVLFGPYISGTYIAVVTDSNGCTSQDSVHIQVSSICGDTTVDAPNIITPNGDGFNDDWYIKNPKHIPVTLIRVFDRWGEMVFETNNPDTHWNGIVNGALPNDGVYTYVIKGGCPTSGQWERSGNITLVR
jgi:gliding motility-associated-like protein